MNYFRYLVKIGLKHKLNLIPIILILGITMFLLFVNTVSIHSTGFIKTAERNVQLLEEQASEVEEYIETLPLSAEETEDLKLHYKNFKKDIEKNQVSIELAQKEKWGESVDLQLEYLNETLIPDMIANSAIHSENYKQSLYNQKAIYEILVTDNLEPETSGIEKKGATFTYRMMDIIFPVIFTLCLIAFLSNLLSNSLIDKMDIEDMFPVNQASWQIKKILMNFFMGFSIYMIWLIITFLVSSQVNGMGSFKYPVNLYTENFTGTSPVISIMTQALILQIIAILFIVLVVYLVALLTKNQLITIFVSTVSLVGVVLLTTSFEPLNGIFHLLPTTYFNATRVATNQLAFQLSNSNITTTNGIFVLSFFSIIFTLLIIIIKRNYEKKQLFQSHNN